MVGFNCVGAYSDMKSDPEFDFYLKMIMIDSSFYPSAKQILFIKFVKNYYSKYAQNKNNQTQHLSEKVNDSVVEKFSDLLKE